MIQKAFTSLFITLILVTISGCSEFAEEVEIASPSSTCYSSEDYIPEEAICAEPLSCDNTEECVAWGSELVKKLTSEYGSLIEEGEFDDEEEAEEFIADYEIQDNQLISPHTGIDQAYHAKLWEDFAWIIPASECPMITHFSVFTKGDMWAWVVQNDDWETWTLAINVEQPSTPTEIALTNIHEFGHLLTLNGEQINPYAEENLCETHYTEDGCLYDDSYLYNYYMEFWSDSEYEEDEDNFVSDYAMTNMEEDIAETWAHFVLTDKPDGRTVAERKVLFFYDYDELVMLRAEILSRVATWLARNDV